MAGSVHVKVALENSLLESIGLGALWLLGPDSGRLCGRLWHIGNGL